MNLNKKIMLLMVITVFLVASCSPNTKPLNDKNIETDNNEIPEVKSNSQDDKSNSEESRSENIQINGDGRYEYLLDNKKSGGPPPDGIPPIEEPDYITVEQASPNMEANEPVFVLEIGSDVYIYPQRVLVWHEIVNLTGEDVALTYCPLTGSAITYKYPQNSDTTFGTSGSLINSNLLMYDRHSESFISQIDGVGLDKDLIGIELETLPTYWMEWQVARKAYPSAKVLSEETGFIRNYNSDPYGSYVKEVSGNYYTESSLIFPPLFEDVDQVFHEKYSVIGLKAGDKRLALDPVVVKEKVVFPFELNGEKFISFYDETIQNIRIYDNDKNFGIDLDRGLMVSAEGVEYELNGQSENNGFINSPIFFEVMWFAWYGFYPDTEVIYE